MSDYDKLNKRSEMTIDGMVTHVGTNYSTATSKYGKIYIPRACGINLPIGKYTNKKITMRARFQGFEGSRISAMPWRGLALISVDYN